MKRGLVIGTVFVFALCLIDMGVARKRGRLHAELSGQAFVEGNAVDLVGTVVTPCLGQEIQPGESVVWCNTFQLAWNELCDFTGGPVGMAGAPQMVEFLNEQQATKADLNETSYVAMAGLVEDGIEQRIRQELDRKFHGQADPELLDSTPLEGWVMYAYLFRDFPFRWAFDRFRGGLHFAGQQVDCFGIGQFLGAVEPNEAKMATQVTVLAYRSNDDLVVELKTKVEGERLILAKLQPAASLAATIQLVETRIAEGTPTGIQETEDLFVPVLDFELLQNYGELCGHELQTVNRKLDGKTIGAALQSIRFRLDERGAVLKSEGVAAGCKVQRTLVFDQPFLVMLKRREAANPYFAMWVGNAELMISRGPVAQAR